MGGPPIADGCGEWEGDSTPPPVGSCAGCGIDSEWYPVVRGPPRGGRQASGGGTRVAAVGGDRLPACRGNTVGEKRYS